MLLQLPRDLLQRILGFFVTLADGVAWSAANAAKDPATWKGRLVTRDSRETSSCLDGNFLVTPVDISKCMVIQRLW